MSFEHTVRIPKERIGVLIGRGGSVKEEIERRCGVSLDIDNVTGEVTVRLKGRLEEADPFLAVRIVTAIGRGFSPERAFRLLVDQHARGHRPQGLRREVGERPEEDKG